MNLDEIIRTAEAYLHAGCITDEQFKECLKDFNSGSAGPQREGKMDETLKALRQGPRWLGKSFGALSEFGAMSENQVMDLVSGMRQLSTLAERQNRDKIHALEENESIKVRRDAYRENLGVAAAKLHEVKELLQAKDVAHSMSAELFHKVNGKYIRIASENQPNYYSARIRNIIETALKDISSGVAEALKGDGIL